MSQFCSVRLFLPRDSRAARTYTAEYATTFCLSVLVFDTEAAGRLPLIGLSFSDSLCSITEFGYVQEQSYFPIELLPDLCNFADLSVFATARRLDCCKCCQLIPNSDRPPDKTRQCCQRRVRRCELSRPDRPTSAFCVGVRPAVAPAVPAPPDTLRR